MYEARPQEGTSLDSAIVEMDAIAAQNSEKEPIIAHVKVLLEDLRNRFNAGQVTKEDACQCLFDLYFEFQREVQDAYPIAGILRVVGDDFGHQIGVDSDLLWDMYQRSLKNVS